MVDRSRQDYSTRRQHPRVTLRMSAEVRTARTVFTATTRDLSEGGVGLSAEYPLEEGSEVVLGLFLVLDDVESDTPPLWVKARVAWAAETDDNRFNAGVRFEVITDDQRKWLRQILAAMAPPAPASPRPAPPAPARTRRR
jgi:c-di-GMP-binding flagellar brake protein YcgR